MNPRKDTRSKILDVAEELFGDQGFERVSVRDITKKARVNLAAIHYHFGSKEDLIAAVFERRVTPMNAARMTALEKAQAGKKAPKVEAILEAFIRPTIENSFGSPKGSNFSKLFGRCLSDLSPEVDDLIKQQFEPVSQRLYAAFAKALPKLPRSDIFWRLKFTFGALHHWHLTKDRFSPPWVEEASVEQQIQKLIAYAAAGFRA